MTVLFNNNFEYRLINEKSDTAGNLILLELDIEKDLLLIALISMVQIKILQTITLT